MNRISVATAPGRVAWVALAAVVRSGAWSCLAARAADAQPPFQAPLIRRAGELLAPDMLAGPQFRVEDQVPTDGFLGHFTLRSDRAATRGRR